ncbi:MAG: 2-oxoacid:acceptor oxidoreductase subunit alpha [Aigarchaeota archaeon]|nr:2-oxoacid:acceptor oxidoreductase subunit alpha [Aigarchaeota archaeon]MDW8092614.1 2-oxoacid:ferredoxin oxidoreductase subunit alpha [Nitrososphaerota archaeon]
MDLKQRSSPKFCWMIGGSQGSGVDSAANAYAYTIASAGYNVFGKREYYSNIKGEHSYFTVVASNGNVRSVLEEIHMLVTFDAETVFRHAFNVLPGGGVIYDQSQVEEKLRNIHTLEPPVVKRVSEVLGKEASDVRLKDVLNYVEGKKVKLYPIPYSDLLKRVGDLIGQQQLSFLTRLVNIMAVAASLSIMDVDLRYLQAALEYTFRGKKKVVGMNMTAAQTIHEYVRGSFTSFLDYKLPQVTPNNRDVFIMNGTTVVGIAKIASGCRFQTYYPITPASDESVFLEDKAVFPLNSDVEYEYPHIAEGKYVGKEGNIVVVQAEDEIAAIDMAVGASLAGVRAATATSGPGFSLMMEGLGWAGMNEVPVVVTLYQRGGPSTGLPTRHEQGDMLFTIHAGHGEFPRIVLASGDMEEAFYDTIKAFNYAERYQMPVIHLLDKSIANSTITLRRPSLDNVIIERGLWADGELANGGKTFKRYEYTESGLSPRVALGTKGGIFWATGDEHDELGHITEDPTIRDAMMEKRMRKIELADSEIPVEEKISVYGDRSSDKWIVSWGSTKGPILDAMEELTGIRDDLAFLQVRLLHPFPSAPIIEILRNARMIIDIEQNYSGQLGQLMRMRTSIAPTHHILKYNGRPFSMSELVVALQDVISNGTKRVVCKGE